MRSGVYSLTARSGIARHGDMQRLFRYKSFLQQEIEDNTLGVCTIIYGCCQ